MKSKALMLIFMLFGLVLTACGGNESGADAEGEVTELTHWVFNGTHSQIFENAVERWNEEFPDRQIKYSAEVYPGDQLHNNLLMALQSGTGAPDITDIEINAFPNFMQGEPQLLSLNEYVEPELENMVESRFDNYAKDGTYYGMPTHVGATVMYYNQTIMEEAGVDIDSIETWADFAEAGEQVTANTDSVMTTFETDDIFVYWSMVSQQNSDLINEDGEIILTNDANVKALEFMDQMVENETAALAPGGTHHAEEYYGFMVERGAAAVAMPFWYVNRFTENMPDLKGEIVIRPLPAWEEGGKRSAGMGGTATSVTNQSEHPELAKEFLAYAKLTDQSSYDHWKLLGVDPVKVSTWDDEPMKEDNEFFNYFGDDIFETLLNIQNEVNPINIGEKTPDVNEQLTTNVFNQVLRDQSHTPAEALETAVQQIP